MKPLTQILVVLALAAAVGLPTIGAFRGWGLGTETNAKVKAESSAYCPPEMRDPNGHCRRQVRSYFYGRAGSGGPRAGK